MTIQQVVIFLASLIAGISTYFAFYYRRWYLRYVKKAHDAQKALRAAIAHAEECSMNGFAWKRYADTLAGKPPVPSSISTEKDIAQLMKHFGITDYKVEIDHTEHRVTARVPFNYIPEVHAALRWLMSPLIEIKVIPNGAGGAP